MSPIPRNTSLRRSLPRAGLIMATSLALIAGLYGPAAQATPAAIAKDPDWTPAKLKSVPVKEAATKPAPIDAGAKLDVTGTPKVVWPGAGTADAVPVADGDPRVTPAPTQRGPLTPTELAKGRAGDLPVWVGVPRGRAIGAAKATSADAVPGKVRVQSLGRQGNQLVLKVGRSDGVRAAGRAELRVNYQQFRHTFGGDWALRLRMYKVPDCLATAQATGKAPAAGCVLEELPTLNDGSDELAADVPVAADGATPGTFVVQAAAASGGGDFKATSLKPSATWTVGGSAGDFNWSYPLKSPPGLGGPVPQVDINYSSGGVDGRTAATNNQPSWVGEGFEFSPGGSIERKYASCASKSEKTGNNGSAITGDLCFATDNATFSLNGKGGELVLDDTTKKWHPRNDDGSTIERITDTTKENGDNDGEYWLLTSKDGTKYYFGLNKVTGYDAAPVKETTNSTFTVPVFGNHGGEPCNKATFVTSWCDQAYKWNLDYVVDRNGNTMTLFYDKEDNFYGRNATKTTVSKYTRAGNVKRIEYGQRDGAVLTSEPVAQVLFTTAPRCVPGTACTAADYPDTPLDQECTSSTSCEKFNPTFWTKKRLIKIGTQVWRASENRFTDVEAWNLRQSFRDPGDNTKPGLWLDAISEEGLVGAPQAMPEVNFDSIQLANRVDPVGDAQPPMNWLRVNTVTYGSGGVIKIDYSPQDCKPGDVPAPDTNGRRCHPMKWTPTNDTERTDWFHKYVVAKVTESDRFLSTQPVVTEVQYLSQPAWRHDDEDGLVEIGAKTWSSWRGYDHVKVIKGHPDGGTQSVTESRYFRGMDGDKLAGGGVKDVKIVDSEGKQLDDLLPLAGQLREQTTYNGSEIVDRTINDQWVSAPTATRVKPWATVSSFQVEQAGNKQVQTVAGGGLRTQAANNVYDAEGVLLAKNDVNNVADTTDDTCTKYEYVKNDALGIQEIVKRELTVSVACDKPFAKEQVVADKRTYYDGAASVDAAPTKGNPTKTERVSGHDASGNPIYEVQSTMAFDALGRPTRSTDAKGAVSTTTYTPAGAGPSPRSQRPSRTGTPRPRRSSPPGVRTWW
ncbi:hypothetical protein OG394_07615 [Kribbella sp. NBC_01245]|uniref:hypothetical protein n=1 Tax=Kribbella sp. NBC_01245 TaxID=2903578 RepID=UPI002E2BF8F2|nr:hypothetical protein [Kribbella sp. NBC_01245]